MTDKPTVLDILRDDNPLLRQMSQPIEAADLPEMRKLSHDMIATMIANRGIGLAAPQVGKLVRLIVLNQGKHSIALPNPVIVDKGGSQCRPEGCLSVPRYKWGRCVPRALWVRLEFMGPDGSTQSLKLSGIFAAAAQHEIDHLNGVLFTDLAGPETNRFGNEGRLS